MNDIIVRCVNDKGYSYEYLSHDAQIAYEIVKKNGIVCIRDIFNIMTNEYGYRFRTYERAKNRLVRYMKILEDRGFVETVAFGENNTKYYKAREFEWVYEME